MYDFVIIHGSFGSPFENWSPWLFDALTKQGKKVLAPQLPTIDQNFQNWDEILSGYDKFIGESTSFIAHSLGPAFVVDYLIKHQKHVKNLYFVALGYGLTGNQEFDDVNKSFFIYPDLPGIKSYFQKAFCFYSDNDPYIPPAMRENFIKHLSPEKLLIPGGGHLNASAGFTEFPQLLDAIKQNG